MIPGSTNIKTSIACHEDEEESLEVCTILKLQSQVYMSGAQQESSTIWFEENQLLVDGEVFD